MQDYANNKYISILKMLLQKHVQQSYYFIYIIIIIVIVLFVSQVAKVEYYKKPEGQTGQEETSSVYLRLQHTILNMLLQKCIQ